MMRSSLTCLSLIKRFEGFSARVYVCPAGYPTIGYGHAVRVAERFAEGMSEVAAERLLLADLQGVEAAVTRLIAVPLKQCQFDALVSFTYNLGAGRLQMSRLRGVINRGEDAAAPAEFNRWVWANGRKLPGLVARRAVEGALYASDG